VKGREAILRIHVKQVKLADSVDLAVIAARTGGFAGADLANLVNEAALLAARRDKTAVDRSDFEEAIDRVVAGLEKKRAMNPRIRRVIAVHEMGHAIVATDLPGLDPVHKVSIVGRGFGALGYTMQLPTEDRYLRTKGELQNELAVLLGGRTAELIVFGEMTTGAQNDLMRATDVARAMVTEYGMSESVGPVNHEGRGRPTFLDTEIGPERGVYAEETARQIDAEVKRLITDAEAAAHRILMARRDLLDQLTDLLLDKEVLEGDEVRQLMGIPAPDAPGDEPAAITAPIQPPAEQS
jgi:cell division protease FtsH